MMMRKDQAQFFFQGRCGSEGEFKMLMRLTDSQLQIEVTDDKNMLKYQQKIGQDYVDQESCFTNIFEHPRELFEYLTKDISNITISNDQLKFEYRYSNLTKTKPLSIKLEKQILNQGQKATLKIQQLERNFAAQFLQYKDSFQAERKNNQRLKEDLEILSKKTQKIIKEHAEFVQAMHKQIDILHIKITNMYPQKQNALFPSPSAISLSSIVSPSSIASPSSILQNSQPQPQLNNTLLLIGNHPDNSHSKYYKLIKTGDNSVRIIRQGQNGKYNFVNSFKIPLTSKVRYVIHLQRVINNAMMIGVCTERGLGNTNNSTHPESIYYYSLGGGYLIQGGNQRQIGSACEDRAQIQCQIYLPKDKIVWWKNGLKIFQSKKAHEFKGKDLYLSLILNYSNDFVDLHVS